MQRLLKNTLTKMKNFDKLGHINSKSLCLSKDLIVRVVTQAIEQKILATRISNKGIMYKIH